VLNTWGVEYIKDKSQTKKIPSGLPKTSRGDWSYGTFGFLSHNLRTGEGDTNFLLEIL